jgi:enediyne biosynthesis protein E4
MSGGVALIDYDRDGWPDIYFTNAPSVEMALHGKKARSAPYHNNRDGTFTDVTDKAGVGYPCWAMGAAVGDLFNDGKLEAVVENLVGGPMILRPEGGPRNHWVSFQLEGVKSNRLALNARVRATAGDLVQLSEVISGGSYLSQNDLRIHLVWGNMKRWIRHKLSGQMGRWRRWPT